MRLLCLFIAYFIASPTAADIYRWTDAAGRIHYSDSPPISVAETGRLDASQLPLLHSQPAIKSPAPRRLQRSGTHGAGYRLSGNTPGASLDECKRLKLKAIKAERSARRDQAEELDNRLWKNCRTWSSELRKIEQDLM